ncbi:UNVERIFIED_CONTAM: hypothetical protein FKN15_059255 [Acipenser sinensis]
MGSSFFCLSSKFIDGRLELLNSGKGFSDAFEEEINMGEYAGSDKTYHQWLFTVKKGSGAIINTVKTKANPAMKTVYKFDIAENGYSVATDEMQPRVTASPSTERKEGKQREERRPITVHFGQGTLLAETPGPSTPRHSTGIFTRREVVTTDVSRLGWGAVWNGQDVQGQDKGHAPYQSCLLAEDLSQLSMSTSLWNWGLSVYLSNLTENDCSIRTVQAYYVDRAKSWRQSKQFFVCDRAKSRGQALSKQRLSKWVADTVSTTYELANLPPLEKLTAYSTRGQGNIQCSRVGYSLNPY